MKIFLIFACLFGLALVLYHLLVLRKLSDDEGEDISPDQPEVRDVRKLLAETVRAGVHVKTGRSGGNSFFGGYPISHEDFSWPRKNGIPLAFLACIDLSEIPEVFDWLPDTGCLLFFYDTEQQPWGFDPKDRGSWSVIYLDYISKETGGDVSPPPGLLQENVVKRASLNFARKMVPPTGEEDSAEVFDLTDEESDELEAWRNEVFEECPEHLIGGFPGPIQGVEMALECQLASNGVYCGDSSGYQSARAKELKHGAEDWRLLFQIDTDDSLDLMWGDVGRIYFWVKASEAKVGDFSNVWLIMQCC